MQKAGEKSCPQKECPISALAKKKQEVDHRISSAQNVMKELCYNYRLIIIRILCMTDKSQSHFLSTSDNQFDVITSPDHVVNYGHHVLNHHTLNAEGRFIYILNSSK